MNRTSEFENKIIQGDCLEMMGRLPGRSIDLVICDLPYGQTRNKWDRPISPDKLWEQYKRIAKSRAAIILFGQGIFTAELMLSNRELWRYNLVWNKVLVSGFLNANKMPLRVHEDIIVFYKRPPPYHPQKTRGEKSHSKGKTKDRKNRNYGRFGFEDNADELGDMKHPTSIITFERTPPSRMLHPTQKPIELLEYLVRTYSNEGDLVLDNCAGVGSTAIACVNTGRRYVGIEIKPEYCRVAEQLLVNAHT